MVGLPRVEDGVQRRLVVEIAVAPVNRQPRRRNGNEHGTRTAFDNLLPLARNDHDNLMAEARRSA